MPLTHLSILPSTMRLDITLISLSTLLLLPASAVTVQKPGLVLPDSAAANKDAVKSIFLDSYEAYKCVSRS